MRVIDSSLDTLVGNSEYFTDYFLSLTEGLTLVAILTDFGLLTPLLAVTLIELLMESMSLFINNYSLSYLAMAASAKSLAVSVISLGVVSALESLWGGVLSVIRVLNSVTSNSEACSYS